MAFDLATAKPVESSGGFDLSTAKLVEGNPPEEQASTPPEVEKGLLARIRGDLSQRVANVKAGAPTGTGAANEYLLNPLVNIFNTGGQAANALGDVVLETGKSAYNVLMPQSGKDLAKAAGDFVVGAFPPETIDTVKGTLGEMARQNPQAMIAADSAMGYALAGPLLKGAGIAAGEAKNLAKDAAGATVKPDYLANMAQSSLKIPTKIKGPKQLQMGRDLLDAGLTAHDAPKLLARSKELSAAVRAELAPVAETQFEGTIPAGLKNSEYLAPYQQTASSAAVSGLQGQPVGKLTLTRGQAQALKQQIDADLTANWKKAFNDQANAWSDTKIREVKQLRDILRADLEKAAPAIKPLNAENSKLIRLEPFVDRVTNAAADAKGKPISTAIKGGGNKIPLVESVGNFAEGVEQKLAKDLWAAQKGGAKSKTVTRLNALARGLSKTNR